MLLKIFYQSTLYSQNFIKDQLQFEKTIFQKILNKCSQEQIVRNGHYQSCASSYKSKIQALAKFTQFLIHQRIQNFESQLLKQCSKHNKNTEILNCIERIEKTYISQYQKDIKYINLMRKQILKETI